MKIDQDEFVLLARDVITELPSTFSAHYFIKRFMKHHEREYIAWLQNASAEKHTPSGIFQEVHKQIGRSLSVNHKELHIVKNRVNVESVNCFGDTDIVSSWHKI